MKRVLLVGLLLSGCRFVPGTDAHDIREAQEAVKYQLRDANSAIFRGDHVVRAGDKAVVCGQVNGKNGVGAYEGFAPYVYGITTRKAVLISGVSPATPSDAELTCIDHAPEVLS